MTYDDDLYDYHVILFLSAYSSSKEIMNDRSIDRSGFLSRLWIPDLQILQNDVIMGPTESRHSTQFIVSLAFARFLN